MQIQTTLTNGGASDAFLAIERAELADSTISQYRKAMRGYLATGAALTDASALVAYSDDVWNIGDGATAVPCPPGSVCGA